MSEEFSSLVNPGLLRLSSLQTYGENLNMEKLHDRDIVIASEPPFPAGIAFCRGPLQEEIEFFQEKKQRNRLKIGLTIQSRSVKI